MNRLLDGDVAELRNLTGALCRRLMQIEGLSEDGEDARRRKLRECNGMLEHVAAYCGVVERFLDEVD